MEKDSYITYQEIITTFIKNNYIQYGCPECGTIMESVWAMERWGWKCKECNKIFLPSTCIVEARHQTT